MKKLYFLSVSGYHGGPEYTSLAEARKALKELKEDEMKRCRKRYGKAFCHRFKNTWQITLARDSRSSLWLSAAIVSC